MASSETTNKSTDHIKTVPLSSSTLQSALNLVRTNFNVMYNLDLDTNTLDELEKMCIIAAKDGISLVVIDETDDTVIGVSFNKLRVHNPPEKSFYEQVNEICESNMTKYLLDVITKVVSKTNPFLYYGVDCILEIVCMLYKSYQAEDMLIDNTIYLGQNLRDGQERRVPIKIDGHVQCTNVNLVPYMMSAVTFTENHVETFKSFHLETIATITYDEVELNLHLNEEADEKNPKINFMIRWLRYPRQKAEQL